MNNAAKPAVSSASALVTHHVFLDTQIYRSEGHNLESRLFLLLRHQIAENRLILHITDITLAEIERQLGDYVAEAAALMKKARKQFAHWRKRLPKIFTRDLPDFDQPVIAAAAFKQFTDRAQYECKMVEHNATVIAASDIFRAYFSREPPFERTGSKEFPDAFVLRALEQWCQENGERMYVVGSDKAMAAAVQKSSALLHMQTLSELLEAVAATEAPDIVSQASEMLQKPRLRSALEQKIEAKIDELIPIYVGGDLADGDVSGHELNGKIEVDDFQVLAASDNDISLLLYVTVPLKIMIDYEDRSEAYYDTEDDVYFGVEAAGAEIEEEPTIRVFVKLSRKPVRISSVQLITSEFDVYDTYDDYR